MYGMVVLLLQYNFLSKKEACFSVDSERSDTWPLFDLGLMSPM